MCQAEGQRLRLALAQDEVGEPTFDGCSQRVLPWRPPDDAAAEKDLEALVGDLLKGDEDILKLEQQCVRH